MLPDNPLAHAQRELLLLRYHEIALKGRNRPQFEERLARNARKFIARELGLKPSEQPSAIEISRLHGRVFIKAPRDPRLRTAMSRLFGCTSYSPVRTVVSEMAALSAAALQEFENWVGHHGRLPGNFRVATRRSDKVIPLKSHEIDREIGGFILDRHPNVPVSLKGAELVIGIEVRKDQSYLWCEKVPGPAGLPVGVNGRALCLLSGGLDSPVAAIQILRRGSPVSYVHFYGTPFVGPEALEKVEDLVRLINRYHPDPEPLLVIPFGKIQERIALATQAKMRTILYRRMMFRIASKLALEVKAKALVTGESLGQVASQTLENIASIDAVAELPVLRPLIAFDKDEIIARAEAWETFETSIRPADDCCTLFADRQAAIRPTIEQILEQESRFPVDELVNEALKGLFVVRGQPRQRG